MVKIKQQDNSMYKNQEQIEIWKSRYKITYQKLKRITSILEFITNTLKQESKCFCCKEYLSKDFKTWELDKQSKVEICFCNRCEKIWKLIQFASDNSDDDKVIDEIEDKKEIHKTYDSLKKDLDEARPKKIKIKKSLVSKKQKNINNKKPNQMLLDKNTKSIKNNDNEVVCMLCKPKNRISLNKKTYHLHYRFKH